MGRSMLRSVHERRVVRIWDWRLVHVYSRTGLATTLPGFGAKFRLTQRRWTLSFSDSTLVRFSRM